MADKPKFHYEEINDQGPYDREFPWPDAFRFDDTDVKKGPKSLATDLRELYDCDVISIPPDHGNVLTWDSVPRADGKGRWVPGVGGGCQITDGEVYLYVYTRPDLISEIEAAIINDPETILRPNDTGVEGLQYSYRNPFGIHPTPQEFIDANLPLGTYENPFAEIQDAFRWLEDNCISVIGEDARINIILLGEIDPLILYLSCPDPDAMFEAVPPNVEDLDWEMLEPYIGVDWKETQITYPYADKVFIYGYVTDVDTAPHLLTFVPDENELRAYSYEENGWALYNKIFIQFLFDLGPIWDLEFNQDGGVGEGDIDHPLCSRYRDAILKLVPPYIVVKNGVTVGGMYNIRLEKPYVTLNCDVEPPQSPG